MNELSLSNDLNVITAEINGYKQVAGQAIFEIGKRLKHVKENDLVYGEWGEWLENITLSRGQATKFITVYEELGTNDSTWNNLGTQALYLVATLPQEEREKEQVTSKGETKTPDEMTVRELQEVKRKLKQTETERDAERAERERLENQEPEIKEVVPEGIQKTLSDAKKRLDEVHEENEKLRKENSQSKGNDYDIEKEQKEKRMLELDAEKSVLRLKIKVDEFLSEIAINAFMEGAIATSGKSTKEKLFQSVEQLKSFTNKMESTLNGRVEI